jgi:hypothetical protein
MKTCHVGIILLILLTVTAMGCTTRSSHDQYTQATIVEKFEKKQLVMPWLDSQHSPPSEAWYNHDYYIRYKSGGAIKADRISVDTYTSVFEGNTYVLKWGYIDNIGVITKEYGYVEVISKVET